MEGAALHSIKNNLFFLQQRKKKFYFDFISWSGIKIYYNSMLKVISWYKLNHKWKTTWIWWKLAGMKWYEFMNGMTFNAAGHQQHFLFFLNCSLRMGNSKKRSLLRPCCPREQSSPSIPQRSSSAAWIDWGCCSCGGAHNKEIHSFSSFLRKAEEIERELNSFLLFGGPFFSNSIINFIQHFISFWWNEKCWWNEIEWSCWCGRQRPFAACSFIKSFNEFQDFLHSPISSNYWNNINLIHESN